MLTTASSMRNMKRLALLFFVWMVCAGPAIADVDFGPQIDWNKFKEARNGDFGVGARLEVGGSFRLITSFDYYFVDVDILGPDVTPQNDFNLRFYELNGDLAYYFPTRVQPYLGAGLSLSKRTFDNVDLGNFFDDNKSELGVNVLGGVKFGTGPVKPFLELRGVFYGGGESFDNRIVLTGGIVF